MNNPAYAAFRRWYNKSLQRFHHGQFSERDIACSAFEAGMEYARKNLSLVVIKKGNKGFRIIEGNPGDFVHLEDDEAIMSGVMGVSNA